MPEWRRSPQRPRPRLEPSRGGSSVVPSCFNVFGSNIEHAWSLQPPSSASLVRFRQSDGEDQVANYTSVARQMQLKRSPLFHARETAGRRDRHATQNVASRLRPFVLGPASRRLLLSTHGTRLPGASTREGSRQAAVPGGSRGECYGPPPDPRAAGWRKRPYHQDLRPCLLAIECE